MDIIDRHPEIEEFRFMCVKLFDQNAHVLDAKSEELLSYLESDGISLDDFDFSKYKVLENKSYWQFYLSARLFFRYPHLLKSAVGP